MLTFVKRQLRRWKSANPLLLNRFVKSWRKLAGATVALPSSAVPRPQQLVRLLILPCDPWTVVGSKGDQAMIAGVVDSLRARAPRLEVAIVVASQEAAHAVHKAGYRALRAWPLALADLESCLHQLRNYSPDACVTLGADVMDGFYSPSSTLRLLCLSDLLARGGVKTCILGFSFNRRPVRQIAQVFDEVTPALKINLRDARSLERFNGATRAKARLVADAAFLMSPETAGAKVGRVRRFVQEQAARGLVTMAVNAHPMLFLGGAPGGVAQLGQALTHALDQLMILRPVALVLLSHDDRVEQGDQAFLRGLQRALAPRWAERLLMPDTQMSAPELKAATGLMFAVLSGRMHLAIAALGSGVPVAALTYQDKFEGLFEHFDLGAQWLKTGPQALDGQALADWLVAFHDAADGLRAQLIRALPGVLHSARGNFEGVF